jgi:hypothetical protein
MLQEPLANPFFQQDSVWVMETRRGKGEEKPNEGHNHIH